MTGTQNAPIKSTDKEKEIARLTTPLTYRHGKAYDSEGVEANSIETISEFRHYLEPKPGILTEDEILAYAKDSMAASQIRLDRGIGNFHDKLMLNQSLPWQLGIYYVTVACIAMPILYFASFIPTFILLILIAAPLVLAFYRFNVKRYPYVPAERQINGVNAGNSYASSERIRSVDGYGSRISELRDIFDGKEKAVRQLIEMKFEPPQITYDRFISSVDSCHNIFYTHAQAAQNIVNMASHDSPKLKEELQEKINSLKSIIDLIDDLTNELIISINSNEISDDDLQNVLRNMENLIGSVKDYN